MEYSAQTQVLETKYNITFQDVMFCTLLAAGTDPADSYHAVYNKSTGGYKVTRSRTEQQAKELLRVNPSFQLCINELKRNKKIERTTAHKIDVTQEITEEEREKYTTRKGLIDEMIKNVSVLTGKDAATALQSIAKLQGLDKPDEKNDEERRKFVLRWLSNCRTCKLMRAFLEIQEELKG